MKQGVLISAIISGSLIGLWLMIGSTGVAIGLAVITLTSIVFAAFALGSWWTRQTLMDGAQLANERATATDQYDAIKMKAITDLIREIIKLKSENLSPPHEFPALPLSKYQAVEGSFTIAGLDEIDDLDETAVANEG